MKKKGFTLIELLAVIVILAIIALIAVPVIMNIITSARKSALPSKTLSELAKTNEFATTVHACATAGTTCTTGEKFAIEVAPGNIQNFYVVSDADNKVTLIMDRNIGDAVAWVQKSDYTGTEAEWDTECDECGNNNKGPITALNYLESQTASWTNIAPQTYTLTDSKYGTITRTNARARMLTETEANAIISYSWSYANLAMTPYGYWTSSARVDYAFGAQSVVDVGYVFYSFVNDDGSSGVRPVIEISKSVI